MSKAFNILVSILIVTMTMESCFTLNSKLFAKTKGTSLSKTQAKALAKAYGLSEAEAQGFWDVFKHIPIIGQTAYGIKNIAEGKIPLR